MNSWNLERKCRKAALAVALWVAVGMLCGCGSREDKAEDTLATQECEESSISSEVLVDPDQVMQYGREVYLGKDASTENSTDSIDSSAQATKGYGSQQSTESESMAVTEPSEITDSKESSATKESSAAKESSSAKESSGAKESSAVKESTAAEESSASTPESSAAPSSAAQEDSQAHESSRAQETIQATVSSAEPSQTQDPCANGHSYGDPFVWRQATCTVPADICQVCSVCGNEKHVTGENADHALEKTVTRVGNCMEPYEYQYTCKNCGYFTTELDYSQMENGHQYSTGSYEEFDEESLTWITITVTKCGICGKELERSVSGPVPALAPAPEPYAEAEGSMFDSPYVVPYYYVKDGKTRQYFTISQPLPIDHNLGETSYVCHDYQYYLRTGTSPSFWYPAGTTVSTGIASKLRALEKGEHYYTISREGEVPVGKWVVSWTQGRCVHTGNQKGEWVGMRVGNDICKGAYYSGWLSYCADCGQLLLDAFVYAPKDRIETIRYVNMDYGYYYVCQNPACHHLENEGYARPHACKQVSANRYVVKYDGNGDRPLPSGDYADVSGRMLSSYHMYDNVTEFEGKAATPVTHLTKCSYSRKSYTFAGWNTARDGSGQSFSDGQEILNLTEYNYLDDNRELDPRGIITLYAQWIPTESTLRIDPQEGSFDGKSGITEITMGYGHSYEADPNLLTPKSLHQVSFETNGGSKIAPVEVPRRFSSWRQEDPFLGKMRGMTYYFTASNGNVDQLTALYENEEITLPSPVKAGYNFGGWYEDPECKTRPVGFGGDPYLAKTDVTLYANWSKLTLWSVNNYEANDKKGAVDLTWEQADSAIKSYKLYKSEDGKNFSRIEGIGEGSALTVSKEFGYTGTVKTFEIPSSGFYELEAYGAKGGDAAEKTGGLGGKVTARFYLREGDKLTITVGGTGGYGGGGSAALYGCGGGATRIESAQLGTLLVAGGGGGATEFADGEPGGLATGLRGDAASSGEGGSAGGGGGYVGGKAGNVIRHTHSDACKLDHVHGPECYEEIKEERICHIKQSGFTDSGWSYQGTAASEYCPNCKRVTVKNVMHFHARHDACGALVGGNSCASSDYGEYFIHATKHVCAQCGYVFVHFPGYDDGDTYDTHSFHVKTMRLICPIDLVNGCKFGYTQGQVISSSNAYGGSSFVSDKAVSYQMEAGVRENNASAFIRGISLGMFDMQSADGVPANDKKAPEAIAEAAIQVCAITESVVDVTWTAPKDGGTPYWFRCESIDVLTGEKLCDSNIVKNVLTTGVAGYYYRLDDAPVITVTAQNADNAGDLLLNAKLRCTLRAEETYLHLAAVDVAGNIGPTTHIKLSGKDVAMRYPIVTRPISIEGEEGKANVYAASDGRIFVRADGVTPFRLSFEAFIGGAASEDYQITDLDFSIAYDAPGDAYAFETKVPLSSDPASLTEAVSLSVSKFIRKGSGEEVILADAGLTGAARGMAGKQTLFWQGFLASESAHGRIICVTPGAAAGEGASYQHSAWEEDEKNCISFIADAQAPVVTCSADLAAIDVINEATLPAQVLVFQATDDLSGLAYFEVKVRNQDTGDAKTYVSDDSGEIRIDYDPAQALFCGDLTMELVTYDNVYNTYQETYGKVEFSLEASIMRILEPHAPRFKRGESGLLRITAIGYAEKIEVVFPPEIAGDAPELNHTFYYAVPTEVASEELQFMIPLYLNVEDEYQVIVRAYKGTAVLEARPELCTLHVAGSILDELRTRLK